MDLEPLVDILKHFEEIYKKNANEYDRDYDLCKKYAKISRYIVIGIPGFLYSIAVLYISAAYYDGFVTGKVTPPTHVYLPFMDLGQFGVILTNLLGSIAIIGAGIPFLPFEILSYVVFANVSLSSTVIRRDLSDLKVVLDNLETTHQEVKRRLLEIIKSHRTYNA